MPTRFFKQLPDAVLFKVLLKNFHALEMDDIWRMLDKETKVKTEGALLTSKDAAHFDFQVKLIHRYYTDPHKLHSLPPHLKEIFLNNLTSYLVHLNKLPHVHTKDFLSIQLEGSFLKDQLIGQPFQLSNELFERIFNECISPAITSNQLALMASVMNEGQLNRILAKLLPELRNCYMRDYELIVQHLIALIPHCNEQQRTEIMDAFISQYKYDETQRKPMLKDDWVSNWEVIDEDKESTRHLSLRGLAALASKANEQQQTQLLKIFMQKLHEQKDENPNVRLAALRGLTNIGLASNQLPSRQLLEIVIAMLNMSYPFAPLAIKSFNALTAKLNEQQKESLIDIFEKQLKETNWAIRSSEFYRTLSSLMPKPSEQQTRIIHGIIENFGREPSNRMDALNALYELAANAHEDQKLEIMDTLIRRAITKEENKYVRKTAISCLSYFARYRANEHQQSQIIEILEQQSRHPIAEVNNDWWDDGNDPEIQSCATVELELCIQARDKKQQNLPQEDASIAPAPRPQEEAQPINIDVKNLESDDAAVRENTLKKLLIIIQNNDISSKLELLDAMKRTLTWNSLESTSALLSITLQLPAIKNNAEKHLIAAQLKQITADIQTPSVINAVAIKLANELSTSSLLVEEQSAAASASGHK